MEYQAVETVDIAKRLEFIQAIPCFSALTTAQYKELIECMKVIHYGPGENIVTEGAVIDSVYILVDGKAEVTHAQQKAHKMTHIPVAILSAGDTIGLNEAGFYSDTGLRTATVAAITEVVVLCLTIKELQSFLQINGLENSLSTAAKQMLRLQIIKQSLPFSTLSAERIKWLDAQVKEETFFPGDILFHQGDSGTQCYLICSGQIEIVRRDENGEEKRIALLRSPALFGETTLITKQVRNATARVIEKAELLSLDQALLHEVMETEKNVATVFMHLLVDRSRPIQNPHVTSHQLTTATGEVITILKNLENHSYFKLSREGMCIWEQLNGNHTLQELTLILADQYNVFAPDMVAGLISRLIKEKFISNVQLNDEISSHQSMMARCMGKIRQLAQMRYAFGDADPWLTNMYQKYIHYLFTKSAQLIFSLIAILGFFAFIFNTADVLLFFNYKHATLLLLLALLPLSLIGVVLHELGHAFMVKAYEREVHYMGVGWFWIAPIAFTDTSDMWLAERRPRMLVNLAGIYVDMIVAGFSALSMFLTNNPYIQCILWSFAIYTYLRAFHKLSPLQELDGYYALMDWVEKPHLRQSAVSWLLNQFPRAILHPRLFRQHRAEVIYWLACLLFIIFTSLLAFIVQGFVLMIFGVEISNPYVTFTFPIVVAIISTLGIAAEIRKT